MIRYWNLYGGNSCKYPAIIGHEFVGTVIEVGKAVHHVKVGDCVVSDIVIAAAVGACRTGHPTFAKT